MKRPTMRLILLMVLCAFCFSFAVSAASETYSIPEMDIKVDISSDYIVLLRSELLAQSDSQSKVDPVAAALFEGNKAQLYAISMDATHIIQIAPEVAAQDINKTEWNYFLTGLAYGYELKGYTVTKKELFRHSGTTFAKICYFAPDANAYVLTYYTALNDMAFSVSAQTENGQRFTDAQEAAIDVIVGSIQLGEKYTESPANVPAPNSNFSNNIGIGSNYTQNAYNTYRAQQASKSSRWENVVIGGIVAAIVTGIYALFGWIKKKIVGTEYSDPVPNVDAAVWECGLCGMKNEKHHKKCQNCGTERYPGSSGGTRPVTSGEVGTWQCANCGTENKNNYSQCKKCGKYRSQS